MKDISELDLKNNIPLASRTGPDHSTVIKVGDQSIGGDELATIAGPCAVENYEQVLDIARHVKACGARFLRGGAFKPLTFPYRSESLFELREEGIEILSAVRRK